MELPWLFAELERTKPATLLDAGSALNRKFIVEQPVLRGTRVHVLTLAPEGNCFWRERWSYLFDDLRRIPIRDAFYEAVACISTLEHVGFDNVVYTGESEAGDAQQDDFVLAMQELSRVLAPGGTLYLTVPYGRPQVFRGFRQFDAPRLERAVAAFGPTRAVETSLFRYDERGWQRASADACSDAEYVDWLGRAISGEPWPDPIIAEPDRAAAARAVACVMLRK